MVVRRLLILLIAALVVVACNSSKRENIQPPRELENIEARLSVSQLWKRNVGDVGGIKGLNMAPVHADGQIYVANLKGDVLVLDAASGRENARFQVGYQFASPVAVGDDTLAIGTLDGKLVVLSAGGTERFVKQLSSEVIAAPLIVNDRIFVRSHDGRVQAFQLPEGGQIWSRDFDVPVLSLRGNGRMLHHNDQLIVGMDDGRLIALRDSDGGDVWQQQVGLSEGRTDLERLADLDGDISLLDGTVFAVGMNGQATAVDSTGGTQLWARDISASGGIAAGDQVVVSGIDGKVSSLDRYGGGGVWTQEGLEHRWLTTPGIVNGYPVVGDFEGYVHWLDPNDGSFVARIRAGRDAIRSTPLVVGDITFILTIDGALTAYRVGG